MIKVSESLPNDFPKLSQPALRALHAAGCTRLEQVAELGEAQLKQLHGVGPNAVDALRRALAEKGLTFRMEKIE